jgi:hypothetical protein
MKTVIFTLALIASTTLAANAETIFTITKNTSVTAAGIPEQCTNCTFNIAEGATLTINQNIYLQNGTFNGGTVEVNPNKSITFWSPGEFNNTTVNFKQKSAIISSGALNINNTDFIFTKTSTATFWAPVTMDNSKMKFLDDASVEITAPFTIRNNSSMVAGDGTTTSKAFIKFNGGTLNELDNSYIMVANNNNYYFNWSAYNARGKSIQTTNNNINCGNGKNNCSAPVVYGPATLNFAGVSSSAVLPVKLSAFNVALVAGQVKIDWTTDMEANASRYEIERSIDGINWNKIGTVKAKGNSSIVIKYAYSDMSKASGNVSYRLKMIDLDETFAYSLIRTVKTEATVQMSVFPNPATNYIVISSKDNEKKNIQLLNINGQIVKQTSGTGNVTLSVSELKGGHYFVKVSDGNGAINTFKVLIAKS